VSDIPPSDSPVASTALEPAPPRGVIALYLAGQWQTAGRPGLLFIASNEQDGEHLGANLHALFPECPVLVLPRWDCLPYDPAGPSREIMGRRASVLRRLASGLAAPLVIATVEAVLQRMPPRSIWMNAMLRLEPGKTTLDELRIFLKRTGYGLDMLVDEPGEAAIHGQVVDIFPAGALSPVRVDHDGRRITRICGYDPVSQRTIAELPEITLDAASEFLATPDLCGEVEADPGGLVARIDRWRRGVDGIGVRPRS
jgi:transcription-repair coupling factor (superfamily II helicase)